MTSSELRAKARESLSGKWGKAVWLTFAYALFCWAMSFIQTRFPQGSFLYEVIGLAVSIIGVALSFGFIISFIRLRRNEDVKGFDFINEGFSRFSRAWGVALRIFLKMIIPIIALIVIMIVLSVSLIMKNGTTSSASSGGALTMVGGLVIIALSIYIGIKGLLYTLSLYIAYDNPEMSCKDCVEKSEELMTGNRGRYFVLQLSFIGWAILAAIPFCIGFLWLIPYIQMATIHFYEDLAGFENNNVVANKEEAVE